MIDIEGMDRVENELAKSLDSGLPVLCHAGRHIIFSGGKRIRPAILLLSYKAVGGNDIERAVPIAASVELIHTATLIHDDINDRSPQRRGSPSVNAMFGENIALLAGDFLFTRLFSLASNYESSILRTLTDSCVKIVEGETQQLMTLGNLTLRESDYLEIVAKKTASLFSTCTKVGAMLATQEKRFIDALSEYGFNVGMAFQIRDDILDLVGKKEMLGKPTTSDVDQKKMSIVTIHALNQSEDATSVLISRDSERIRTLLKKTGSLEYGLSVATMYMNRAKENLTVLPRSDYRDRLADIADMVVMRES
jgi:geranylgeranyl pyrophosphate synthase